MDKIAIESLITFYPGRQIHELSHVPLLHQLNHNLKI